MSLTAFAAAPQLRRLELPEDPGGADVPDLRRARGQRPSHVRRGRMSCLAAIADGAEDARGILAERADGRVRDGASARRLRVLDAADEVVHHARADVVHQSVHREVARGRVRAEAIEHAASSRDAFVDKEAGPRDLGSFVPLALLHGDQLVHLRVRAAAAPCMFFPAPPRWFRSGHTCATLNLRPMICAGLALRLICVHVASVRRSTAAPASGPGSAARRRRRRANVCRRRPRASRAGRGRTGVCPRGRCRAPRGRGRGAAGARGGEEAPPPGGGTLGGDREAPRLRPRREESAGGRGRGGVRPRRSSRGGPRRRRRRTRGGAGTRGRPCARRRRARARGELAGDFRRGAGGGAKATSAARTRRRRTPREDPRGEGAAATEGAAAARRTSPRTGPRNDHPARATTDRSTSSGGRPDDEADAAGATRRHDARATASGGCASRRAPGAKRAAAWSRAA